MRKRVHGREVGVAVRRRDNCENGGGTRWEAIRLGERRELFVKKKGCLGGGSTRCLKKVKKEEREESSNEEGGD